MELGDAADLTDSDEILLWFNQGQARLQRYLEKYIDIEWEMDDKLLQLPEDFVSVHRMVFDTGCEEGWVVFGKYFVIEDQYGATRDGTGRLLYYADWPHVNDAQDCLLDQSELAACIQYAMHRFYRKLVSNRVQYRRYATLLGANAIGPEDLMAESERLLQDYLDARADQQTLPPTSYYGN